MFMFTSVQDHNCPSCGNKQLFRVNGLPLLRTTRRALHGRGCYNRCNFTSFT